MSASELRLDDWRALGEALPDLVRDAEDAVERHWLGLVEMVLEVSGVSPEDPLHAALVTAASGADVDRLALSAPSSALRVGFENLRFARELLGVWQSVDEEVREEDPPPDPWNPFWERMAESFPDLEVPEELGALRTLPGEAKRGVARPMSFWPLTPPAGSGNDAVGEALAALGERAGIDSGDMPAPRRGRLDVPLMWRTDVTQALSIVAEWVDRRETWSRTLGRIAPYLHRVGRR